MFSSRSLAALALLAAAAALPPRPITTLADADFDEPPSWWAFPSLDALFRPLLDLFPAFSEIGPRIEVDDDRFRVIVNVKDYAREDLKVGVKGDFLFVRGSHEAKDGDRDLFASQFFHTYSLPANASATDVTAVLHSDGYLAVTAPLRGAAGGARPDGEVRVPIAEDPEPYGKAAAGTERPGPEEAPAAPEEAPATPEEGPAATTERAADGPEPTTAADREEVTERDEATPRGPAPTEADELNEVRP